MSNWGRIAATRFRPRWFFGVLAGCLLRARHGAVSEWRDHKSKGRCSLAFIRRFPEGAQAFIRLGFPGYFRVELAWAKLIGVVVLLAPAPARLKEWAYAGFAINLVSALIAHLSMGDGPDAVGPSAITGVLWGTVVLLLAPPGGHAGGRT